MAFEGSAGRAGPLGEVEKGTLAATGQASFPGHGQLHVLLVDDERLSRTVVSNLLRKCNYQVTTAESGAEAMELLRKSPHGTFQLVLTDICMPGDINGIELLQLVKQDDSFRSVPVIMMSSIEQDETVLQCVQSGAEEYLVKPVTKKELQHIWQHVWRKQLASAATVPQVRPSAPAAPGVVPVPPPAVAASPSDPGRLAPQAPAAGEAFQRDSPPMRDAPVAEASAVAMPPPAAAPPAAAAVQQQAQQPSPALPLGDFIASPASLEKRLKLFGVAVALLQSCHAHATPLRRLRPYSLGITPQGLRVIEPPQQLQQQPPQEQQQHGGDVRLLLDSLYASPEEQQAASATAAGATAEAAGSGRGVTMAADVYSLGALFVDLFLPCASVQERCAQLTALQAGVLPAELAGAGVELTPLRDFLKGLLHPEPRLRPMLAHVLRSGQLQEINRLVHLLPSWRTRQPQQVQQQPLPAVPSTALQQQPTTQPSAPAAAKAPAAQHPQQQQPVAAPPSPSSASASASSPGADYEGLQHFLRLLRESRQAEVQALQGQLAAVDADVTFLLGQQAQAQAQREAQPQEAPQQQLGPEPPSKRRRVASGAEEGQLVQQPAAASGGQQLPAARTVAPAGGDAAAVARLDAAMPHLEKLFFARRAFQGWSPADLDAFGEELEVVSQRGALAVKATLRCGDMASPMEMACCVAFDRDDALFATVGVSRRIKLFDFGACLASEPGVMHYPVLQMATRSKLSSVSWNAYVRSRLVTADYDGLIQLWDAGAGGAELQHFDEHARRVWSVDFSRQDPTRFLSGSDDGTVRLWSMHDEASVLQIKAPANVCSVQFSPEDSHLVAFGCANYKVYAYDLRSPGQALGAISGPQRAVSYVRFMGGSHLVAASTDSAIRLWDLREVLTGAGGGRSAEALAPQCCFRGHRNQRNFVGLSVTADGYIACGSEDNQVHCYYRSLPFSIGCHQFASGWAEGGGEGPAAAHPPFVSAVCWANRSRHLLAANSQGTIQVLQME